ncbi:NAD(P)-binding protein [Trichoderma novae-zelandiae]
MPKKIATVVGATGNQGSAFISVLLRKAEYHIRGVTRNPASDASNTLKEKGVEIIRANLNGEGSLNAASEGSHLIFGITDFVPGYVEYGGRKAKEIEVNYGLNIARAAQATTTLEHFTWSTLPGVHDATGGQFSCPNFDGEEFNKYIRADASLLAKTTFLMIGWHDTNFKYPVFTPVWVELARKYVVIGDYPANASLPCIGDIESKNGTIVIAYVENVGFEDLLKRWAEVHGKEAIYVRTSHETISQALWPQWTDLAEMARFMGAYKGNNWIYQEDEVLTAEKLGIPQSDFVPLSESLKLLRFD